MLKNSENQGVYSYIKNDFELPFGRNFEKKKLNEL